MLKGKMRYVIKSVPSDNPKALENLLNDMSEAGWDLYSMHEAEAADEGFQYNCIFITENPTEKDAEEDEIVNISNFKSQMERMLSQTLSPYETCQDIQEKIKNQRKKITKIKSQLESEASNSKNRKHLNDDISNAIKELDNLRQQLIKTISPDLMYSKVHQDKLSISLSEEILDLVNPDLGASLIPETVRIRQKLTEELGYVIPRITFEDDENLSSYEFSIKVRGIDVVKSSVYPGYLMFFEENLNTDKKIKSAIYSADEITGRSILWIEEKKTKSFWEKGLNPSEFISRLLEYIAIKHVEEILDYNDVNKYVEIVGEQNIVLLENIIPEFISVPELRYLLVNLIREEVSIKDIIYIFEKINDFSDELNKEDLLDKIRLSLSKHISKKAANDEGIISGFELSEKSYNKIFDQVDSDDKVVRIDGGKIQKITKSLLKKVKENKLDLTNIIVITPLEARHLTFAILSQFLPSIKVLAREEISNDFEIEIIDEI